MIWFDAQHIRGCDVLPPEPLAHAPALLIVDRKQNNIRRGFEKKRVLDDQLLFLSNFFLKIIAYICLSTYALIK